MCGQDTQLYKSDVEGTILNVCKKCSNFGKVISVVKKEIKEEKKKVITREKESEDEIILTIVGGYGEIIKNKREKLGIKQEDFAKKINEKASLMHKIETNHFEPNISLARKIEKVLHVSLIEIESIKPSKLDTSKSEGLTIGDFIKVKK